MDDKSFCARCERHKIELIIDALRKPTFVLDLEANLIAMNKDAKALLKTKAVTVDKALSPPDGTFVQFLKRCGSVRDELFYRLELEPDFHLPVVGSAIRLPEGRPLVLLREDRSGRISKTFRLMNEKIDTLHKDLYQERMRSRTFRHQSCHDPLTHLYNRYGFEEIARKFIAAALRDSAPLALVYGDLNKFKPINDIYGHAAGDTVLQAVGQRLKDNLREGCVCGRLGGDEFAILFTTGVSASGIESALSRLTECLAKPIDIGPAQVSIGVSFGTAFLPEDGQTYDALTKTADKAMYESKPQSTRAKAS